MIKTTMACLTKQKCNRCLLVLHQRTRSVKVAIVFHCLPHSFYTHVQVTEEDVELVFKMCDDSRNAKIDPNEIKKAIAFWYGQLAEREEKKNAKGGGGSKMCLIL